MRQGGSVVGPRKAPEGWRTPGRFANSRRPTHKLGRHNGLRYQFLRSLHPPGRAVFREETFMRGWPNLAPLRGAIPFRGPIRGCRHAQPPATVWQPSGLAKFQPSLRDDFPSAPPPALKRRAILGASLRDSGRKPCRLAWPSTAGRRAGEKSEKTWLTAAA